MQFKDHFSDRSAQYARYRPTYPASLFEWLASTASGHECAWDCATGSGQAARPLAAYFARVIATDGSGDQIANAVPAENISYRIAVAEYSGIESNSVDLVTVAQALHWFDRQRFYREVKRVGRDDALFAAWTYSVTDIAGPIGDLLRHYHNDIVGRWWPPERALVESRYASLTFPFEAIETPLLPMRFEVTAEQLVGYLGTWSATRACVRETGRDPLARFADALAQSWPADRERLDLELPLTVRAGWVHAGCSSP